MKFSTLALAGTAAAAHLSSRTDTSKLPKLTSANRMQTLRQLKLSQRDASRAAGMFELNADRKGLGKAAGEGGGMYDEVAYFGVE